MLPSVNSQAGFYPRLESFELCLIPHAKYVISTSFLTYAKKKKVDILLIILTFSFSFSFHLSFIPQIREGMTVISNLPPSPYHETDNNIILNIFSSIGRCRFLDEKHFDACTALAGSGPAFVCTFLEAMADGGVMMGLPRMEALELAAQSE